MQSLYQAALMAALASAGSRQVWVIRSRDAFEMPTFECTHDVIIPSERRLLTRGHLVSKLKSNRIPPNQKRKTNESL